MTQANQAQVSFMNDPTLCTPAFLQAIFKALKNHRNKNVRNYSERTILKRLLEPGAVHCLTFYQVAECGIDGLPLPSLEEFYCIAVEQEPGDGQWDCTVIKSMKEQMERPLLRWLNRRRPHEVWVGNTPIKFWTEAVIKAFLAKFPAAVRQVPIDKMKIEHYFWAMEHVINAGELDSIIHYGVQTLLPRAASRAALVEAAINRTRELFVDYLQKASKDMILPGVQL